jgi:hypothetical protein
MLSAGRFAVVTDDRVYRRQELSHFEETRFDGRVLVTKAFIRVPFSEIRMFFFHSCDCRRVKKRGRYGRIFPFPVRFRKREKFVKVRVITENRRWLMGELGSVVFVFPKGSSRRTQGAS